MNERWQPTPDKIKSDYKNKLRAGAIDDVRAVHGDSDFKGPLGRIRFWWEVRQQEKRMKAERGLSEQGPAGTLPFQGRVTLESSPVLAAAR